MVQLLSGSWLPLGYEGLLRDPAASLAALATFMGIDAPRPWLAAGRQMIDPAKSGAAAAQLDPAILAVLRAAYAPGERALAAATPTKPSSPPRKHHPSPQPRLPPQPQGQKA